MQTSSEVSARPSAITSGFMTSYLWMDTNIAVCVDQVFNEVSFISVSSMLQHGRFYTPPHTILTSCNRDRGNKAYVCCRASAAP